MKYDLTRRKFVNHLLKSSVAISGLSALSCVEKGAGNNSRERQYHLSLCSHAWEEIPELPEIVRNAGITHVWLAAFLYGSWYRTPEQLVETKKYLVKNGFKVEMINVPLGHPGNALGENVSDELLTPPLHWKNWCTVDGKVYSGTSIHAPAVEENVNAAKALYAKGFKTIFLDDDFRIARSPGQIGGCFCKDCQSRFLSLHGYSAVDWDELINSVMERKRTPVLENWVNYWCDELWNMFAAIQNSKPDISLGNMIMYLGSEKAGIALDKFRNVLFRVGELMFSDREFEPLKGKTDELFSSLFHRRFAQPELAYSETTAFPADKLSAKNMAAKLAVSLISDVRNTMFMSGLDPFPITHWDILGPAMRKSAMLHKKIAGHRPAGLFKHYWGMDSRLIGKDKPFSLFLASGIPFEVVEDIPENGWVFLSDEDAGGVLQRKMATQNAQLVIRNDVNIPGKNVTSIKESIKDIMELKNRIIPQLEGTFYVGGEAPVVFSHYPTAQAALLWNVGEKRQTFDIIKDGRIVRSVSVDTLDVELVEDLV